MKLRKHGGMGSNLRASKAAKAAVVLIPLLVALSPTLWAWLPPSAATEPLQVTFFDVGQGDAAWLKTPDGWDILIDGGRKSEGPDLLSYLQSHGVTEIEVLVLSHPHADHVGGLITILKEMDAVEALLNCQDSETSTYQEFQDLLENKGVPTTCVRDGDNFTWGEYISASAVNPAEPLMSEFNNNSVVLRVSYGTIDFLFTGDIEEAGENRILNRGGMVEAEILKVAHHGSGESSTAPFLAPVDPEIAVISVGANPYGHPAIETLQRLRDAGATIYRTDRQGTIVVTTDGTNYSVEEEIPLTYIYLSPIMKNHMPTTHAP